MMAGICGLNPNGLPTAHNRNTPYRRVAAAGRVADTAGGGFP